MVSWFIPQYPNQSPANLGACWVSYSSLDASDSWIWISHRWEWHCNKHQNITDHSMLTIICIYIYTVYTLQHHCEQILNYWRIMARIMANDTQQTHSMAITIESWRSPWELWSTDLMNSDEDFLNITILERGKYMTVLFQKPWQGRSAKIASFAGWYFCFVTVHSPMIIHIQTSI